MSQRHGGGGGGGKAHHLEHEQKVESLLGRRELRLGELPPRLGHALSVPQLEERRDQDALALRPSRGDALPSGEQ